MGIQVLQRPEWSGEPYPVGDLFRLQKEKAGRPLDAVCHLVTYQLGWELRLDVAGSLQRSQVCRGQDEVLNVSEAWKAAMIEKGWASARHRGVRNCVDSI